MRLSAFIRAHTPDIIVDWDRFASSLPSAEGKTQKALRDHIAELLEFIANDIEAAQSDAEQTEKSKGKKQKSHQNTAAEVHASLRQADGFDMDQMVSEYRALRASVVRLWEKHLTAPTLQDIDDLIRFNEAIDQVLTESITHYSIKLEHSRNIFLSILGHDIRNPLGAARMCAELTLKISSDNLNEKQIGLLTQGVESIDRVTEIVDHLLDITRARLGSGLPVLKKPLELGFVATKIVEEMRAMHPQRSILLTIKGDTQGNWDSPRMAQVFSNLLGNAVQYGSPDSPIRVTVEGNSKEIALSVHNNGKPIPANKIDTIFNSMTRAEEHSELSNQPNLGLGLYITQEVVTAHGGTIEVSSTESAGTLFSARFPRTQNA